MGFGLSGGGQRAFRPRGDHKGGAELTLSGGVTLCKGKNTQYSKKDQIWT